jgi:hypothetical protein
MSRRKRSEAPQPLQLELRTWRLGIARLAYNAHGETVQRLTDQILSDLTGMSFPQLAAAVEAHNAQLAEPVEEIGDDEPESAQESLEESAANVRYPRTASHGVGQAWSLAPCVLVVVGYKFRNRRRI